MFSTGKVQFGNVSSSWHELRSCSLATFFSFSLSLLLSVFRPFVPLPCGPIFMWLVLWKAPQNWEWIVRGCDAKKKFISMSYDFHVKLVPYCRIYSDNSNWYAPQLCFKISPTIHTLFHSISMLMQFVVSIEQAIDYSIGTLTHKWKRAISICTWKIHLK